MKQDIHPQTQVVTVTCTNCGTTFKVLTTLKSDFTVSVCSHCHPAYTGQVKDVTRASRVAKFLERQKKAQALQKSRKTKK